MKSGLERMFNADSPVRKAGEAELYVKDPTKGDRLPECRCENHQRDRKPQYLQ